MVTPKQIIFGAATGLVGYMLLRSKGFEIKNFDDLEKYWPIMEPPVKEYCQRTGMNFETIKTMYVAIKKQKGL